MAITKISTKEETTILNKTLGENRKEYTLFDVFEILPKKITKNHIDYDLFISHVDIAYFSFTPVFHNVMFYYAYNFEGSSIFDALNEMIIKLKNDNLL